VRLACGLGFGVVPGSELEDRGRWADLWFGGCRIASRCGAETRVVRGGGEQRGRLSRGPRPGRPTGLALRRLHEAGYVPTPVIVSLRVPDGPHQHIVSTRHGPDAEHPKSRFGQVAAPLRVGQARDAAGPRVLGLGQKRVDVRADPRVQDGGDVPGSGQVPGGDSGLDDLGGVQYDADLDAAFERARAQGDLTPLVQTVRRWWFEADAWRDPEAQRGSWPVWIPTGTRDCRLPRSERPGRRSRPGSSSDARRASGRSSGRCSAGPSRSLPPWSRPGTIAFISIVADNAVKRRWRDVW
jgi:hypothetical protein